ncbi:hypothetical protein [Paenibacillus faecalis]|uniref:hypothetical protein n=1 Tax=Paenibacillus faecalis TaxID=2079532 RepID=UPI000D0EBCA5|nr:hypothetical protein [Paenibacillus faecalis]
MKTLLAAALGAIMLIAGGMYAANGGDQAQTSVQKTLTSPSNKNIEQGNELTSDIKKLPEYKTLAAEIDLSNYTSRITENNPNNRVIILTDVNGKERYKSVFVKKEDRLKIIDFRGGLIFNDHIQKNTAKNTQEAPETKASISNTITQLPEYKTLAAKTDLSGYSAHIVEDNRNKRIILFKDANDQEQFKTVYVKETGLVKIINL